MTEAVETEDNAPQLAPTTSLKPRSRPAQVADAPAEEPAPEPQPAAAVSALPMAAQTPPPPDASAAVAQLSPREEDVLREIARGASNKEIARTLDIAETTVKIHVQHILRKLGLSSRVQAAVYASDRQRAE